MARIFWKKTGKSIGDLTEEQRRNLAFEIVDDSSKYLFSSVIDQNLINTPKQLEGANIDLLFQLHQKWCDIYGKERKRLIEIDYYHLLTTLKKQRKLVGVEILKWKIESAYLFWLDEVIQTPLMDIYKEILAKRNSMIRLQKWTDELENFYREISFGQKQSPKEPYLVSLNLLIREKIPFYSEDYEINLSIEAKNSASSQALQYQLQSLANGIASQSSNFREIFYSKL